MNLRTKWLNLFIINVGFIVFISFITFFYSSQIKYFIKHTLIKLLLGEWKKLLNSLKDGIG